LNVSHADDQIAMAMIGTQISRSLREYYDHEKEHKLLIKELKDRVSQDRQKILALKKKRSIHKFNVRKLMNLMNLKRKEVKTYVYGEVRR